MATKNKRVVQKVESGPLTAISATVAPVAVVITDDQMVDFLSVSRTVDEICAKFHQEKAEVMRWLKGLPRNFRVYEQKNSQGDDTYVVLKEFSAKSQCAEKRIWTPRFAAAGQPYLVIEFTGGDSLNKIKVLPLADIWFGDNLHDAPRFDEYVNWIHKTPEAFVVLNGNALRPFGRKEEDAFLETVVAFEDKLRPIAHKILCALSGANEDKSARGGLYDPLGVVCADLKVAKVAIPHFTQPVYADILWRGQIFTFFCFAGTTYAQTKGGKINAAIRPTNFQELTHFTIMGKAMDKMVTTQPRIVRNTRTGELEYCGQHIIVCPSFKKYFGSLEAKKGYKPSSLGAVSCNLFSDGRYEYSS